MVTMPKMRMVGVVMQIIFLSFHIVKLSDNVTTVLTLFGNLSKLKTFFLCVMICKNENSLFGACRSLVIPYASQMLISCLVHYTIYIDFILIPRGISMAIKYSYYAVLVIYIFRGVYIMLS